MDLLCRAAAMDPAGTLAPMEVSPGQRVANATADAIVQPPFVWVACKNTGSLPPSVIVVQAERAHSPWELDVGEATVLVPGVYAELGIDFAGDALGIHGGTLNRLFRKELFLAFPELPQRLRSMVSHLTNEAVALETPLPRRR